MRQITWAQLGQFDFISVGRTSGNRVLLDQALAGVPNRLGQAVAGWDEAALSARQAPGEWSAVEALAHLRAADDIVSPRFAMILVRDRPPLPAFDEAPRAGDIFKEECEAAVLGMKTPEAAMASVVQRVSPLLPRNS